MLGRSLTPHRTPDDPGGHVTVMTTPPYDHDTETTETTIVRSEPPERVSPLRPGQLVRVTTRSRRGHGDRVRFGFITAVEGQMAQVAWLSEQLDPVRLDRVDVTPVG